MGLDAFIKFLKQLQKELDTGTFDHDFDVQIRWLNEYDGVTSWHPLFKEGMMTRHGYFPHQAEYRIKRHN